MAGVVRRVGVVVVAGHRVVGVDAARELIAGIRGAAVAVVAGNGNVHALADLAGVRGADVAVVAVPVVVAVRGRRVRTSRRLGVARVERLGVVVVALVQGGAPVAAAVWHALVDRANVAIVADRVDELAHAGERIAHVERARVTVGAVRVLDAGAELGLELTQSRRRVA